MYGNKINKYKNDNKLLKLFDLLVKAKAPKTINDDTFFIGKKIFKPSRLFLLTSTAFVFTSYPVLAQTTEWIGTTSDWYTGSNWSGGSVPSTLNNVLINTQNNPATVTALDGNGTTIEVQTLVVGNGAGSNGHLIFDASAPNAYINIETNSAAGGLDGITIGKDGGTGIWDVKLIGDPTTPDGYGNTVYISDNIIIGTGAGSNGTLNVLSEGKNLGGVGQYSAASTLRSESAFVGQNGGTGVANIIDASWGIGVTSTDTGHLGLYIGDGAGSNGTVNVLAGGKLAVASYSASIQDYDGGPLGFVIGRDGGVGTLNVSGSNAAGASIANTGIGLTIGDGAGSIGNLNILAGGKVSSFDVTNLSGPLPDGAIVNHVGVNGGTGTILVSGAGSTLLITGKSPSPQVDEKTATTDLYVGVSGNGSLTIADGGLAHIGTAVFKADDEEHYEPRYLAPLNANGIVYLARDAGSVGIVNYGAAADAAPAAVGTLNAAGIVFGAGTGAVVFNHTDTNLQYSMPLSGEGQINVHNGTTWINNDNSAGFTNIRQEFDEDNGEIIDVTQTFTEGFSGYTNLYGGILGLNNNFAIGSSEIYGRGNATLAYGAGTAPDGVVIANTITVVPDVTLALAVATDISATQEGAISGAGNIDKTGAGTLTLTANNSISGEVKVSEGILALSGSGEVSQAKRVVADAVFDITEAEDGAEIRSLAGSGTTELGDKTLTISAGNDLFSGIIQGTGGLTVSGGIQSLSGANSYSGATTVSGGVLRAEAINTFSPNSIYSVADSAVLDLNDYNQFLPELTNAGLVRFGEMPGTVLTVNQYTGAGGTLLFNTTLNDDNSASDILMIDGGTATGTSNIRVVNAGGLGAQTTSDGILLVGVLNGGTTEENAFSLSGRAIAGPYEYSLLRGGLNGANSDQWYLRSVLDCDLQPNAEICDPTGPVEPPEYREEVSLYSALSSLALKYGSATVDSLHERMGITRMSGAADENMGWGRVIGLSGKKDADGLGIYGNNGPAYDYNIFAMQTGIDFYRAENAQGSLTQAGIHAAFGRTTADVDHFNGNYAGRAELDAWSLGLYLTHQASAGWYVDSIVQGTYYDADVVSAGSQSLTTKGYGFIASVETGYPFQLKDNWTLEPQAQLAYQIVNLDDANDGAASVQFSKAESLQGRLGLKLAKNWALDEEASSRKTGLWLRASVLNEFLGKPKTMFSSQDGYISFRDDISGAYGQITAGVSYDVTRQATIYGTLGYQARFDGDDKAFNGKLGLKASF